MLGYSALDFTLIDPHWGTVQEWADAIDKVHERGMYFIVDFTVGTMGNLMYVLFGSICVNACAYILTFFPSLTVTARRQSECLAWMEGLIRIVFLTVNTLCNSHLNDSAPFSINECEKYICLSYLCCLLMTKSFRTIDKVEWTRAPYGPWNLTQYPDFNFTNTRNESCVLPTFYNDAGEIVSSDTILDGHTTSGCMDSAFDQYGDMEAFGVQ